MGFEAKEVNRDDVMRMLSLQSEKRTTRELDPKT